MKDHNLIDYRSAWSIGGRTFKLVHTIQRRLCHLLRVLHRVQPDNRPAWQGFSTQPSYGEPAFTLRCTRLNLFLRECGGALTWGAACMCAAAAYNYGGILVARAFIGIGEAGFGNIVPLYYTYWYKKDEIALRCAQSFPSWRI